MGQLYIILIAGKAGPFRITHEAKAIACFKEFSATGGIDPISH